MEQPKMRRYLLMALAILGLVTSGLYVGQAAQAAPTPHVKAAVADPGVKGLMKDEVTGTYQVVTRFRNGSYVTAAPSSTCPPCEVVQVGTPIFTGAYKNVVSGPHVTKTPVYQRTVHACHGYLGGFVVTCITGTIVYAAGFAACFNGCTVAGKRGMQYCNTSGSYSLPGFSYDLTGCRNHLMSTGVAAGYGSVAYEEDKICNQGLPVGVCQVEAWHVNAYGSGNVTGPYGGVGGA